MRNTEIFNRTLRKLYRLVQATPDTNGTHRADNLFIEIKKDNFENNEWEFLIKNQRYFIEDVPNKTGFDQYPVYEIDGVILKTNPTNVMSISNKFNTSKYFSDRLHGQDYTDKMTQFNEQMANIKTNYEGDLYIDNPMFTMIPDSINGQIVIKVDDDVPEDLRSQILKVFNSIWV